MAILIVSNISFFDVLCLCISGPFPVCNLSLFLTCVQSWKSKYCVTEVVYLQKKIGYCIQIDWTYSNTGQLQSDSTMRHAVVSFSCLCAKVRVNVA